MGYPLWLIRHRFSRLINMTQDDPGLARIVAQFKRFDVETSRAAYVTVDCCNSDPIARLCPIPNTDRFELFYWSNTDGRWRTLGNVGRMKLMLESAREIVENDPMYRVPRSVTPPKLAKVELSGHGSVKHAY